MSAVSLKCYILNDPAASVHTCLPQNEGAYRAAAPARVIAVRREIDSLGITASEFALQI